MNSMQWKQEARPLLWPWMLTFAAGILAVAFPARQDISDISGTASLWHQIAELILPIGAFFAIPLLATLTIGNEFQYRTLALRLSQPAPRQIFWQQKVVAAIAAVAPLMLVYGIALQARFGRAFLLVALIWIALTTAGAIPFTFLARSTIGGLVLSSWVYAAVAIGWVYFENHGAFSSPWLWLIALAVVLYACAMLWLGRRMVLRYQATEGVQGESFAPGAGLVPEFVAEWFRSRPAQPIFNLVRREFHLLRMLWTLCALCMTAWVFIVAFNIAPHGNDEGTTAKAAAFGLTVILTMLLAHLAGTLSLSEEKTLGTHAWQLTMPVSPTLQWLVKLGVAFGSSMIFSFAIPMALLRFGGAMRGDPELYVGRFMIWVWPAGVVAITVVSFWAACFGKGAVRATIWFFALLISGTVASQIENWVGLHRISQRFWPDAFAYFDPFVLARLFRFGEMSALSIVFYAGLTLPFLAAVWQSRVLFRAQEDDTGRRFARWAAPLVLFYVVPGLLYGTLLSLAFAGWEQKDAIIKNLHTAIEANVAAPNAPLSHNPTVEDLNRSVPLTDATRRWLGNATIATQIEPYAPNLASATTHGRWQVAFGEKNKRAVPYLATIHTGDGKHTCTLKFTVGEHTSSGITQTVCDGE